MTSQNDRAWTQYLQAKGLILDGTSYTVVSDELKQLTGREPRLLAKFDQPDQLPVPFKHAGYTLLPVANGVYTLFQGNVFVPIPACSHQQLFTGRAPFHLETADRGSGESQYIDQAYIIGILSNFVSIPRSDLFLTIRGRERVHPFQFSFAGISFDVNGVQIEVDAGYEGPRDIVLIEAKIGIRGYFNVRQLYYPYRHFAQLVPKKRVRLIFVAYDLAANRYYLYEVAFQQRDDPGSWHFLKCQTYQLPTTSVSHVDDLIDTRFTTGTDVVPQADDLNRIIELLDMINNGQQTAQEVAESFDFNQRQSHYYREAAEYLGLVEDSRGRYQLTPHGQQIVVADVQKKREFLARSIVNSWIFAELIDRARRRPEKIFRVEDIDQIIASATKGSTQRYNNSTIPRRRRTIVAWIRWLSEQFACFEAQGSEYQLK